MHTATSAAAVSRVAARVLHRINDLLAHRANNPVFFRSPDHPGQINPEWIKAGVRLLRRRGGKPGSFVKWCDDTNEQARISGDEPVLPRSALAVAALAPAYNHIVDHLGNVHSTPTGFGHVAVSGNALIIRGYDAD